MDKYLEAVKKTIDQVKDDYQKNAEESIKLDLILLEIAEQEKINASDEELKSLITASRAKDHQMEQVRSVILRRKTLDYLMSL